MKPAKLSTPRDGRDYAAGFDAGLAAAPVPSNARPAWLLGHADARSPAAAWQRAVSALAVRWEANP